MDPKASAKASSDSQSADASSSTINETKALAPLTEEWWLATKRQVSAGKHVVSSEWKLTKHAFAVAIFLGLCLMATLTTLLITLNITAAYGLYQTEMQIWLIGACLIALNFGLVLILVSTVKRVLAHIHMNNSLAILKGKNSLVDEEKVNE